MNESNVFWQKASKYVPAVLIALALFLLVQTVNGLKEYSYIGGQGIPQNVVEVTGRGEVSATPDIATFSFSVSETAKTVKEAQDVVTKKTNDALAKIESFNIDKKDVKTTDYSVSPKYEYVNGVCTTNGCPPSKQNLVGYEVSQSVVVKVRKVDDAGKVLGSMGDASVTNISGLSFTIDDEDALNREARVQAIDEAKTKAEALAKDLGVKLVRIVSYSENGSGYPMPMYTKMDSVAMSVGGESAPNIPTGQNKIVSNVTIVYEIR